MPDNPIHSIRAVLDTGRTFGGKLKVYPLNVVNYCILDLIDSIVLRGSAPEETRLENVVETVYVMTLSPEELRKIDADDVAGTLSRPALEWFKKNRKAVSRSLEDVVRWLIERVRLLAYVAPDLTDEGKSSAKSTNGWIPTLMYFAMNDLRIGPAELMSVPLSQLMLMLRQKIYIGSEGQSMTLQDKELIDKL